MKLNTLTIILWPLMLVAALAVAEDDPNMNSSDSPGDASYATGVVKKSDRDVLIPRPLVGIIQKKYIEAYKKAHPEEEIDESKLTIEMPRRLLNIEMYLRPKTIGVLKQSKYRYDLPPGGGTVDLAQAVHNHVRGSFYVDFSVRVQDAEEEAPVEVFYVSNAKVRQISERSFGMGCNKFADITGYFSDAIKTDGLKVNTTEQRYVSVLAGTFFFVWPQADALHIGSLTFEDSRFPTIQCREL